MAKLQDSFYLVLTPTRHAGAVNEVTGQRPVVEFRTGELRRGIPRTSPGEVAVRINLALDASVFAKAIPVVDVNIAEGDVFVNVAVTGTSEPTDVPEA